MTIRLVATDLDGTLLRSDGTLSLRTRIALNRAEEEGVSVIFVTARPPRWLPDLAGSVGSHGTIICLGGACVVDVTTMRPTEFQGFAPDLLAALLADLRHGIPDVALGLERASGGLFDPAFQDAGDRGASPHARVEQSLHDGEPTAKVLVRRVEIAAGRHPSPEPATAQLLDEVREVLRGRATLADAGSPGLAELLPVGVSKAAALERWCAVRGIAREAVWAFGDMPNDLPMLAWAGRSFAMANAHPAVRAAATDLTSSNDADGVARVLERLTLPGGLGQAE